MSTTTRPIEVDWYAQQNLPFTVTRPIAYLSPEIGILEGQASGGLGHLAADVLRGAAALGIPMVGVTLLYPRGYFEQSIVDGTQHERYRLHYPGDLGLRLIPDKLVRVELLPGRFIFAQLWEKVLSDQVREIVLDPNIEENPPELRHVALYGGEPEERLVQEILLGIGGIQALELLGLRPQLYHFNEGHAGFGILPLLARLVDGDGLSFEAASTLVREHTIFTTHTPVAAGIGRYSVELIRKYFAHVVGASGLTVEQFLELGRFKPDDWDCFNQAAWALRLCGTANGVSELHGHVSNGMFESLWLPSPVTHVLNGVDLPSWTGSDMAAVYSRHVSPEWARCATEMWGGLIHASSELLWSARLSAKRGLIEYVRRVMGWDQLLDERRLTIVYARRVPEYKQLTLLLKDKERLLRLLRGGKLQLVFAGKAHPRDEPGKALIAELCSFIDDPEHADIRPYMVFLPNYDAEMAKVLVAGADVWLNHPRFEEEASGTSGMKAALNGAINLTVPDGWCYTLIRDGYNGWLIGGKQATEASELASFLYNTLERQVIPLWDARGRDGFPHAWIGMMVRSIMSLAWPVSNLRMMMDYVQLYNATLRTQREFASA